ncbi:hypothetical protein A2230_03095 [candidate division WOR-1 bacterium RIFOXYA2_FULL_36_21]|uniref:DUF5678 domain-containing protein n=1 Tax=candidate division WOR-1 bacterium RIFOXYB2_FULL_36_35 TaxID=1802578 RepID=A0A1F4S0U5_UNCSA|nr:MAG: hypothetical protein A2230_03095 [candidate division WOR-1 bacterium RIFOXYA2_FULL_36_21]OGC14066.1 MAG: hypothetical protein A2290_07020 [candidate division WOR-1 bacterium RIFOXYB2_FULL_36_35]OGC16757.1 MAG: hypothetical protein A2282_04065 [candidate division WOR-1 bacterium RIFOXYA12_FULL_36_13]
MANQKRLIDLIYSNSKYFGRHVVIIHGKIYSAKTGKEASRILEKAVKKYPLETPTITYVPKADSLILFSL